MSGAPPRDPLLAYAEEIFGYPGPPISSAHIEDPLLTMHRQWLARNAEHTRRRELLLLPKVHVPLPRIPSLPSPASPPTHARTLLYGIPGLRTPTQKSRWECALRVEMLAAKVHAPPPAAESKGVYR